MDGTTVAIVLQVSGTVVVIVCVIIVWRTQGLLSVRVTRGVNDDDTAAAMFICLVNEVENEMIIHDDGDNTEDSIYNNDKAIEAVRKRLGEQTDLTIKCFFNENENIKMVSLGEQFPGRFVVRHRQGERPDYDIHYKIIDGRKGYLSVHDPGGRSRKYEMVDCTDSPQRIRHRMFGKFYDQVKKEWCGKAIFPRSQFAG